MLFSHEIVKEIKRLANLMQPRDETPSSWQLKILVSELGYVTKLLVYRKWDKNREKLLGELQAELSDLLVQVVAFVGAINEEFNTDYNIDQLFSLGLQRMRERENSRRELERGSKA